MAELLPVIDGDGNSDLPYNIDTDVNRDETISAAEIRNALNALQNLVKHTHFYVDSYGGEVANCNCNCSRGLL